MPDSESANWFALPLRLRPSQSSHGFDIAANVCLDSLKVIVLRKLRWERKKVGNWVRERIMLLCSREVVESAKIALITTTYIERKQIPKSVRHFMSGKVHNFQWILLTLYHKRSRCSVVMSRRCSTVLNSTFSSKRTLFSTIICLSSIGGFIFIILERCFTSSKGRGMWALRPFNAAVCGQLANQGAVDRCMVKCSDTSDYDTLDDWNIDVFGFWSKSTVLIKSEDQNVCVICSLPLRCL